MKVAKKELPKSQVELLVELPLEEFKPYIKRGAEKLSQEIKIEGFRPGHAPYDIIKAKVGEMTVMEEGARLAINKNLRVILRDNVGKDIVGQPQIEITKLAPGNPIEFKIVLSLLPDIKLGDYRNLKIKEKKAEVKEEEAKKAFIDLQEYRVKEVIADREAKKTDKIIADINMYLDNVSIEGGQGKDAGVIIGKDYIIPGFDKNLVGAKKGETREFKLPYPDDHHMKNIAGKMVDFKVTVKEVYSRELPLLDDEFAKGFGAKNLDELKENIRKSLAAQIVKENTQKAEREMIEKILNSSRFGDIPQTLVEQEAKTMISELEHTVERQGGKFGDYLSSINKTADQLALDLLPDAVKRVKASLLIREISKIENIKVGDNEIKEHIKEMKKHYQGKPDIIEKVNTEEYEDYVYNVMASRKVIDKLREWNITVS